jgi:hypothetical protein
MSQNRDMEQPDIPGSQERDPGHPVFAWSRHGQPVVYTAMLHLFLIDRI